MQKILTLDSGSSISTLQSGIAQEVVTFTHMLYGVTGDTLHVKMEKLVPFELNNISCHHSFLICTLPTTAAGTAGMDFLTSTNAVVNL
jgi:hypothetical protein